MRLLHFVLSALFDQGGVIHAQGPGGPAQGALPLDGVEDDLPLKGGYLTLEGGSLLPVPAEAEAARAESGEHAVG